MPSSRWAYS